MLIPEVDLDIIPLDIFGQYTFVLTSFILCKEIFAYIIQEAHMCNVVFSHYTTICFTKIKAHFLINTRPSILEGSITQLCIL
jgi:hypothetical protein